MSVDELCSEILRIRSIRYPKYDVTIKKLFSCHNSGLGRLLGVRASSQALSEEFGQLSSRRADAVILQSQNIHHFEFQTRNDATMHLRMLEYLHLIMVRHNNENIRQVVVYIGKEPLAMRNAIRKENITYSYEIVNLSQRCDFYQDLIESEAIEDNIAGLLCTPTCQNNIWRRVLRKLFHLDKVRKADAFTMLHVVSLIRPVNSTIEREINNMAAEINCLTSTPLRQTRVN